MRVAAPSRSAGCARLRRLSPRGDSSAAAVAAAALANPVTSVKLGIGGVRGILIQPGLVELDVLDGAPVPRVDQMELPPPSLDQGGVRELEMAPLLPAHEAPRRVDVGTGIRDPGVRGPGEGRDRAVVAVVIQGFLPGHHLVLELPDDPPGDAAVT